MGGRPPDKKALREDDDPQNSHEPTQASRNRGDTNVNGSIHGANLRPLVGACSAFIGGSAAPIERPARDRAAGKKWGGLYARQTHVELYVRRGR
jgi:hypothetical protein